MKLRLNAQLLFGFSVVLAIALLQGLFGLYQLAQVEHQAEQVGDNWLPSIENVALMTGYVSNYRVNEFRLATTPDPAQQARIRAEARELQERVEMTDAAYARLISSADEARIHDEFSRAWHAYVDASTQVARLAAAGQEEQAVALVNGPSRVLVDRARSSLDQLVKLNHEGAAGAREEISRIYRHAAAASLAALALLMAAGTAVALAIARHITRRLRLAIHASGSVAQGNLTEDIVATGHDEVADLLRALRAMQQRLAQVVGRVRQNAESVSLASAEIAQGNIDLSSRTEQQASALQETAASMEEIQVTARQNAENAARANQLSQAANGTAARGGEVVSRVVDTMREIDATSSQVADIITVIDGIAFQTNILALNAAVEAARAGEQGRGFAVVAGEVRTLAQRCAEAARQIKSLIAANATRVEAGGVLVAQAGDAMAEIMQSIQRVTDIVGEIHSASGEQAAGVTQVGEAVSQMDQVTQQNAALVEESAAAAESLRQQASQLQQVVSFFQVGAVVPAGDAPPAAGWDGIEHRSPGRAANVTRIHAARPMAPAIARRTPAAAAQATGTDDWAAF